VRQRRVAFDFAPGKLITSASSCPFCAILLGAIQQFQPDLRSFTNYITSIYAWGPEELQPHTLSLEIYFEDSRPKLELELHSQSSSGMYTQFR
jgi:hypothetical protein